MQVPLMAASGVWLWRLILRRTNLQISTMKVEDQEEGKVLGDEGQTEIGNEGHEKFFFNSKIYEPKALIPCGKFWNNSIVL